MPIISVRNNENNRWKRNEKNKTKQKNKQTNTEKNKGHRCYRESAKSRAWRSRVLACLACLPARVLTCLCAHVLGVFMCLRLWRVSVLTCLTCLCAWCAYVCKCVLVCLIYFAFQYLNLKILTAKNCVLC